MYTLVTLSVQTAPSARTYCLQGVVLRRPFTPLPKELRFLLKRVMKFPALTTLTPSKEEMAVEGCCLRVEWSG